MVALGVIPNARPQHEWVCLLVEYRLYRTANYTFCFVIFSIVLLKSNINGISFDQVDCITHAFESTVHHVIIETSI